MTSEGPIEAFARFEADGWVRASRPYADTFGKLTMQWAPFVLEQVQLERGSTLLDLASGPGHVAVAAVELGAEVVGVDFSPEMVELARELYPGLEFRVGNAEALDSNDGSFDAVTMSFGLPHLPQPARAFSEAFRVLKPGGRAAFSTWSNERGVGAQLLMTAIRELGTLDVDLPFAPEPPLGTPDDLRTHFEVAGFVDIKAEVVVLDWHLSDPDELFRTFDEGTVRMAATLRAQDDEARASIREQVSREVQRYAVADGYSVSMAAIVASGRKP